MTITVEKIAGEVKGLPEKELDEFLSWLADYELAHPDRWDREIERDSQPGGRLDAVLSEFVATFRPEGPSLSMKSLTTPDFWATYAALPPEIKARAQESVAGAPCAAADIAAPRAAARDPTA